MTDSGTESGLIEHIAVPRTDNDLFATGQFDKHVTVWSFETCKKIREIPTLLDFGGRRLGLVRADKPIVVAGSWTQGVAAYEGTNGSVIWLRRDLENVQHVRDLSNPDSLLVGVGMDHGSYDVLDADTGKCSLRLRNVKEVYASPFESLYLLVGHHTVQLSSALRLPSLWRRPLVTFAVLHAAFSPTQVVYSEANGSVYCFDLNGSEIWTFHPGIGHHVLQIVWDVAMQRWLAVNWDLQHGGSKTLVEIDRSGSSRILADIGTCSETEFFSSGKYIITSDGNVIATASVHPVWRFAGEE